MPKRRYSQRSVVTVHDDDEGYVTTPVQHISSAAGSTTISTEHVMVPISPQKEVVITQGHVPDFSDVLGDGYDADADDDHLGIIHYIKAPRAKRYPNAVSQLTISLMFLSDPFLCLPLGCTSN